MKKLLSVVLLVCGLIGNAFAEDRYIADNLFTYMHAGPSNKYRIIGSVNAGDKVKLLQVNSKYSQILDTKGRTGWVENRFVTTQTSMAERLPKLEKELASVKEQLANARKNSNEEKADLAQSLTARNKQITELEQSYNEISQQLTASQTEVRKLRTKLDTHKDDMLFKWFMYGGGVAGGGLLFGLILPHLIPRHKKSPGGWA